MLKFAGNYIAGMDEVGRGPLVGPVVAAAVMFNPQDWESEQHSFREDLKALNALNDSKKLSAKKREFLYEKIIAHALSVGIGFASAVEIDEINILQASFLAMSRAIERLTILPSAVWVDGSQLPKIPKWSYPSQAHVGGDAKILEIAAASIIAKVTRDRWMQKLEVQYPGYGFAQHAGYPTRVHLDALKQKGPIPEHRKSYAPVREVYTHV